MVRASEVTRCAPRAELDGSDAGGADPSTVVAAKGLAEVIVAIARDDVESVEQASSPSLRRERDLSRPLANGFTSDSGRKAEATVTWLRPDRPTLRPTRHATSGRNLRHC